MKQFAPSNEAVSPVIGVMLMLVVTIIVAAVVSAFAGGMIDGQETVPQASISGSFSIADGMTISNNGGDPLSTENIDFVLRLSDLFGSEMEAKGVDTIDKTIIYKLDSDGNKTQLMNDLGEYGFFSFSAGDTLYINESNCNATILQPNVAPHNWTPTHPQFKGYWPFCFQNPDNIGKYFYLEVIDENGNLISRSEVTVTA